MSTRSLGPRLLAAVQRQAPPIHLLWVSLAGAALGLAYWVGGWPLVFLTVPAVAGGLCAIARLTWILGALDLFEAWAPSAERLTRVDHGRFTSYVVRPWMLGLSSVIRLTSGIKETYLRAAVRVAAYLYFAAGIALAAYFGLVLFVGLVLLLVSLTVLVWLLDRLPGDGGEQKTTGPGQPSSASSYSAHREQAPPEGTGAPHKQPISLGRRRGLGPADRTR